jgi:hypothetical protein
MKKKEKIASVVEVQDASGDEWSEVRWLGVGCTRSPARKCREATQSR